jgi:CRISPR-associated protein Cas2
MFGLWTESSVFGILYPPTQWGGVKDKLLNPAAFKKDGMRFYMLGSDWKSKIEYYGCKNLLIYMERYDIKDYIF